MLPPTANMVNGNLALKPEDPQIDRPIPVGYIKVSISVDIGGNETVGHEIVALHKAGVDIPERVRALLDVNGAWFHQWFHSAYNKNNYE